MRKKVFFLFLFSLIVYEINAQSTHVFTKNDNIVSAGIGLGNVYFSKGYSATFPVNPVVCFEHAFSNQISAGINATYAASKFGYANGASQNLSATYFGIKGAYHFDKLLDIDKSKFDLYSGGGIGYVIVGVSNSSGSYNRRQKGSGAGYALYAGSRYFFNKKTAVYAEAGYVSLAIVNVGVSFKL